MRRARNHWARGRLARPLTPPEQLPLPFLACPEDLTEPARRYFNVDQTIVVGATSVAVSVSLINMKGGVGKTTVASQLAPSKKSKVSLNSMDGVSFSTGSRTLGLSPELRVRACRSQ